MKQLDMNGNPCPIPVIQAKKELDRPDADGVIVLVDNLVAVQNLQKMAQGKGHDFSYEQQGEGFQVVIRKRSGGIGHGTECEVCQPAPATPAEEGVTVLITSCRMGSGSDELGAILMKGFLFSLTELPVLPKAVLFLNSGVQLAVKGSNTVDDLQTLSDKGVRILACGTCLNYYSLTDQLAVGEVTDMFGIAGALASAARLITL